MKIPRKLHFIWIGDQDKIPEKDLGNPLAWSNLNVGYAIRVWKNEDVLNLIQSEFPSYYEIWHSINLDIKRADFARLLVLIAEGGGYLDFDLRPKSPIDSVWKSGVIYNKSIEPNISRLPDVPSQDYVDYSKMDMVLSKENCRIDKVGFGIANGVIFSRPGEDLLVEFIEQQKNLHKGKVLDYMGPFAFTRFIRTRVPQLMGRTAVLHPHYFLFEGRNREESYPDYCVSTHPGINSWGQPEKKKWWDVA